MGTPWPFAFRRQPQPGAHVGSAPDNLDHWRGGTHMSARPTAQARLLAALVDGPVAVRALRRRMGSNYRRILVALVRRGAVREVLVAGLPSIALHGCEEKPALEALDPKAKHSVSGYTTRMPDGICIRLPAEAIERAERAATRLSTITPTTKSAVIRAATLKGLALIEGEIGESPVDTLRRLARERVAERRRAETPKDAA